MVERIAAAAISAAGDSSSTSPEFRDPLPVAVVVEEAAGLAGPDALGGIGARLAHVALDARGDHVDPARERAAHADRTVPLERCDLLVRHARSRSFWA